MGKRAKKRAVLNQLVNNSEGGVANAVHHATLPPEDVQYELELAALEKMAQAASGVGLIETLGRDELDPPALNPDGSLASNGEEVENRDFSQDQRDKLADSGKAMPDGSFPIVTSTDLHNAVKAYGRAKDPAAAKTHIIKRAKALGMTDALPDGWVGNSTTNSEARPMGREATINWLVTNCDCWKHGEGREILNTLDDERLDRLKAFAEPVVNAAMTTCPKCGMKVPASEKKCENCGATLNASYEENSGDPVVAKRMKKKAQAVPPDDQDEDDASVSDRSVSNREGKPMTEQEWMAAAPPGIRAAVQNAMRVEAKEKAALIQQLVSNVADPDTRKKFAERYSVLSLDDLQAKVEELNALAPASLVGNLGGGAGPATEYDPAAMTMNFLGMGSGAVPTNNYSETDDAEMDGPALNAAVAGKK